MTRRPERRVLPLLPRREERGGERRGIFARVSHLPSPPAGGGNTALRAATSRGALDWRDRGGRFSLSPSARERENDSPSSNAAWPFCRLSCGFISKSTA